MDNLSKICLIGDIVIDITLKQNGVKDNKLRFGGITHAARGLWALNAPYFVEHFNPQYMDEQIEQFLKHHGCYDVSKLGNVIGAPYIYFIKEVKEVGDQGYEFLLQNEKHLHIFNEKLEDLKNKNYNDVLLFAGNYPLFEVALKLNKESNYHLDLTNNIFNLIDLQQFSKKLNTIFISTSSLFFRNNFKGDFKDFAKLFSPYSERLVLKENRGGSRAIDFQDNILISIPSQNRPIQHSVGVGDVYDSSYVINYRKYSFYDSLILSSWIAGEYASTTYPDNFKKSVQRIMTANITELNELGGISLAWEDRKLINIYIAAPDFDYINTDHIETLCNCLIYHNFMPRRPIKENGQIEENASTSRKQELFLKDMNLLEECQLFIAVLINNDPGTLVEIGIAATKGIPTFVYDPYSQANNCMLTQIPDLISNDLDEIISEVFTFGSKLNLKK